MQAWENIMAALVFCAFCFIFWVIYILKPEMEENKDGLKHFIRYFYTSKICESVSFTLGDRYQLLTEFSHV